MVAGESAARTEGGGAWGTAAILIVISTLWEKKVFVVSQSQHKNT